MFPKKLNIKDNDFLVSIRHTDFVKALSDFEPTPEQFAFYKPIVNSKVNMFYAINKWLCIKMGVEKEDLTQIALCWLVNYCGLHEKGVELDDTRLFHVYLRQRFQRLKSIMDRKLRSTDLDGDRYFDNSDEITQEYSEKDTTSTRGRKAAKEIDEELAKLPKNKAIQLLKIFIKNNKDPKLIKTAQKHLSRLTK